MPKIFGQPRNFNGIQYEGIRKVIDQEFNTLHDDLSDCYYNFWKLGNSKPFIVGAKSYDVQATVEESKTLFDKLHGLIHHLQQVKLHNANDALPVDKRYIKLENEKIVKNELGEVVGNKVDDFNSKIDSLKQDGIEIDVVLTVNNKEVEDIISNL